MICKKHLLWPLMLLNLTSNIMAKDTGSDFFEMNYNEKKCVWRYEGCVHVDDNEIDFRSTSKKMLDEVFSCMNTIEGCSEEQQERINELKGIKSKIYLEDVRGIAINSQDLKDRLDKYEDLKNQKKYFIPLALSKSELITFAAATSLGLIAFENDQEIMDYIQDTKTEQTQKITNIGNLLGREAIVPVAAGSYFLGMVFKNGELKNVGLITVTAGLATQLVTEGFKKSFKRVRPNGEQGPYEFGVDGNNSFVSGHTSGAFSLATVISEIYKKDHAWVPYVAYGAAALTAYSRMHDEKHWASDVIGGAIVGHLVTKIVMKMHSGDDRDGGFMLYPSFDRETGTYMMHIEYVGKRKQSEFKCAKLPEGREKISACIEEAFERSK